MRLVTDKIVNITRTSPLSIFSHRPIPAGPRAAAALQFPWSFGGRGRIHWVDNVPEPFPENFATVAGITPKQDDVHIASAEIREHPLSGDQRESPQVNSCTDTGSEPLCVAGGGGKGLGRGGLIHIVKTYRGHTRGGNLPCNTS